jgi:hypothetical protein
MQSKHAMITWNCKEPDQRLRASFGTLQGWINYFGRFRPWELHPFLMRINAYLVRWIRLG